MNKIDEYWFWVSMAISEPNQSNKFYYFNKFKNELFGLIDSKYKMTPIFRNEVTKNNYTFVEKLEVYISNVTKENDLLLLPRLTLKEKKKFLTEYSHSINDPIIKTKLLNEAITINESDSFDYKNKNEKIFNEFLLDFEIRKGEFISKKVIELFEPIGVSIEATIIW